MAHPLLCWDIYLEGRQRRSQFANDSKRIQEIMDSNDWHPPIVHLDNTLVWENKVIIITDSKLSIVHATENIFAMNGYKQMEVVGKHPTMFQGTETESAPKEIIRSAINSQRAFDTVITNYKKDGSLYKCHIMGYPIFNKQGSLVNFLAIENAA